MKKFFVALAVFFLVPFSGLAQSPIELVNPGFDLMTLRPPGFTLTTDEGRNFDGFTFGISAMDFLPDGRLVVATFFMEKYIPGDLGLHADPLSIYIMDNVQGDDRSAITATEIATGFRDTHGLKVLGDSVFLLHKQAITRCIDNQSGGLWDCAKIFDIPDYLSVDDDHDITQAEKLEGMGQFHQFNLGIPYKDGFFYIGLTTCIWGCNEKEERNSILEVARDGSGYEFHSGGVRSPGGLGLGPEGEVFVTDNQGNWLPDSKLIHAREGRFYGFRDGQNYFQQEGGDEFPPAVWVTHGEIGRSPTRPALVKQGTFKGQMVAGDIHYGGLQRYFLERVDGDYQGAVFRWSGGFEGGINTVVEGPDGALYLGMLGGPGSNWKWFGADGETLYGFQKITPNGTTPFEMKAVRSRANGFEIEFTQPVDEATAGNANNYSARSWHNEPGGGYGGGSKVGMNDNVNISAATVSGDKTRVMLEMNPGDFEPQDSWPLQSSVIHITVSNNVKAESGDSFWHEDVNEVWYTLNKIGPADVVSVKPEKSFADGNILINSHTLSVREGGRHTFEIHNLKGQQIHRSDFTGPKTYNLKGLSGRGVFFVRVTTDLHHFIHKMVSAD